MRHCTLCHYGYTSSAPDYRKSCKIDQMHPAVQISCPAVPRRRRCRAMKGRRTPNRGFRHPTNLNWRRSRRRLCRRPTNLKGRRSRRRLRRRLFRLGVASFQCNGSDGAGEFGADRADRSTGGTHTKTYQFIGRSVQARRSRPPRKKPETTGVTLSRFFALRGFSRFAGFRGVSRPRKPAKREARKIANELNLM